MDADLPEKTRASQQDFLRCLPLRILLAMAAYSEQRAADTGGALSDAFRQRALEAEAEADRRLRGRA